MKSYVIIYESGKGKEEWSGKEINLTEYYPCCSFCRSTMIPIVERKEHGYEVIGWECCCEQVEKAEEAIEMELLS